MFGIEKAHMILDEMIMDGQVAETNRNRALAPVGHIDKFIGGKWTLCVQCMVLMMWEICTVLYVCLKAFVWFNAVCTCYIGMYCTWTECACVQVWYNTRCYSIWHSLSSFLLPSLDFWYCAMSSWRDRGKWFTFLLTLSQLVVMERMAILCRDSTPTNIHT